MIPESHCRQRVALPAVLPASYEKYAPGGYLKLRFPEGKNAEQLKKLRAILADKDVLRQIFNRMFEEEKQ